MLKEWFEIKKAEELGIVKAGWSLSIFCIIKETEKAVYAMLDCGSSANGNYRIRRCSWIPKSAITNIDEIERIPDYEKAKNAFDIRA